MSLLDQIFTEEKILHPEIIISRAVEQLSDDLRPGSDQPPAPGSPTPCPNCNFTSTWLDVYGGGPHCMTCSPPPAQSLVASVSGSMAVVGEHTRLYGMINTREFFLDHRGKRWWVEVDEARGVEVFSMDEKDRRRAG